MDGMQKYLVLEKKGVKLEDEGIEIEKNGWLLRDGNSNRRTQRLQRH